MKIWKEKCVKSTRASDIASIIDCIANIMLNKLKNKMIPLYSDINSDI